jgi:SSS family solute:Na+ symporter
MASSFTSLDLVIVVAYLAALAIVGAVFSRRQTSADAFLVAGRRMAWFPVGMSLMAALNSGIDYLTQPSATIQYGLVLVTGVLSWLFLYPWVATVVFPFYKRLNFYSVYEYLESRFDVRVRTLAAAIFIVWRLGWMATALYVPCLAIDAVTGGAVDLTLMIVVLGGLVTLYTMLGGIQAVIWNDVMQFCVMFGGLGATVAIVAASVPGGFTEIWSASQAAGKTALWAPIGDSAAPDTWTWLRSFFQQPIHVPALFAALIVGRMAQYTSDQVMVLRLQTTRTVADARRAFIVNAAGDALWMIGLSFVGLALFTYFQNNPPPTTLAADRMLPYFMSRAFPVGAVGLVIAAILAASLSSIDSAIHSCSSVMIVDVYNRLILEQPLGTGAPDAPKDKVAAAHQVRALRIATALAGAAGTTLACNVAGIGTLLEIANKVINSFTGPLFGIFLLAMFSARATSLAALLGGGIGALASYYVAYHSQLGFLWPSTFGLAATLLVGALVSLVSPAADRQSNLTWRAVMQRPLIDL